MPDREQTTGRWREMWDVTVDAGVRIDAAALFRLGAAHGVQTWPVVLDLWPGTVGGERADVRAEAGLIEDGEPVDWFAIALRALAAPERTLEVRRFTTSGTRPVIERICLVRNGYDHVLAHRRGAEIDLRSVQLTTGDEVARRIAGLLAEDAGAEHTPSALPTISAPTEDVADRLADARGADGLVDAFAALGASAGDAMAFASALSRCRARTEIVAICGTGGSTRTSGAVAVFDTERGRIVASPSRSPDGRVWTTLAPGGGHRLTQAVGLLIDTLPGERWMP